MYRTYINRALRGELNKSLKMGKRLAKVRKLKKQRIRKLVRYEYISQFGRCNRDARID